MTPDEIIRKAHAELDDGLSLDLLSRVVALPHPSSSNASSFNYCWQWVTEGQQAKPAEH